MLSSIIFGLVSLFIFLLVHGDGVTSIDYGEALNKSLLYYEAQRSGKLPPNQRVQWRGYSALSDGSEAGVDLEGGYYDAGDNVKFGFPFAFTITMLSWSTIEFHAQLKEKDELSHALEAIKWGTDYLIKAHPEPHVLYGQVGDGDSDHPCWQRPEDMTTPRPAYRIDEDNPGADLAAETAAAFAAASLVFMPTNEIYASLLLTHAKQLFEFASNYEGVYQSSITQAAKFYSSSGYEDELLWASVWLFLATGEESYLDSLEGSSGGTRSRFSWDDKYLGAQVLVSKLIFEEALDQDIYDQFKFNGEQFICNCLQKGEKNVIKTLGGLLWFISYDLQYVTTATFIATTYSEYLTTYSATFDCPGGTIQPNDLLVFAKSQVDYILGSNPRNTSYMVGLGSNYPKQVHHRGASIVSIKINPEPVTCLGGFLYFNSSEPNPNVLDGAVVSGPDENDNFYDLRSNYEQAEPTTVTTAPLVGILAKLALSFK
nr:endoglucanase 14-like [Quercus suber]